jgi:hypothetical protein
MISICPPIIVPKGSSNNVEAVHKFLSGFPMDISSSQEPLFDLYLSTKQQLFKLAQSDLWDMFKRGNPGIKESQAFVLVKASKEPDETLS